jgi:hypothetical protein
MSETINTSVHVETARSFYREMETRFGGALKAFRPPQFAQIMDAFEKKGVEKAEDITHEVLSDVAAALRTTAAELGGAIKGLQAAMKRCPFGGHAPDAAK